MVLTQEIWVDWDQDRYFCIDALPGDALNLLTEPKTWADFAVSFSGAGGSVSLGDLAAPWGTTRAANWTSGTAVSAYVQLGAPLDSIADVTATLSPHTLIFWVESTSASYNAINMQVEIRNASNTLITTSSAFTVPYNGGTLYKVAIPFTTLASGSGVIFRFGKVSSATSVNMWVHQVMVVAGTYSASTAPDFNMGDATNGYDNIFPYAIEEEWNIGAREAYIDVADMNILRVTLNNQSRAFSPENAASPLSGLMADRPIQVRLRDGAAVSGTKMFEGFIQEVQPTPGATSGPYHAILTATSSRRYWEGQEVRIPIQASVTADDVIDAIRGEIDFPPGGDGTGVGSIDVGTNTWPYAGDNWQDGVSALDALASVVASERGFVYWSRNNLIEFRNRTWRYDSDDEVSTLSATFDNDYDFMEYDYGLDLINDVAVKFYPRKLNGSTTTIWELDESIVLAPSGSETIIARYRSDKDNRFKVGATNVAIGVNTVTATINKTLTPYANSCKILLENPNALNSRTQTALSLTGNEIRDFNPITVQAEDATSIAAYGRKTMQLDLKLVATRADAKQIRDLELARHKDPRGHVRSITITNRNADRDELIVDLEVGMKIRVIEDQTQHDGTYIIMGEEHKTKKAHAYHEVTYFLEPAVDLL